MIERFENLTAGISSIYKSIQRIKRYEMRCLGLKGPHVTCMHYLSLHPEGITAAELSRACGEDKAGISRILNDLFARGFLSSDAAESGKKYRAPLTLTEKGRECAREVNDRILRATKAGGQGLSEQDREAFYRVLFQISGNLEQFCRDLEAAPLAGAGNCQASETGLSV